jgi:uncharacterized protein YciI
MATILSQPSRVARWVVRVERGGPWDWSKDMRQQEGWDGHAAYMDAIFDEGFLLLAGPLEGDRYTLWVVEAESEDEIRRRMKEDPWSANAMLTPITIERWTIVLDRLPKPNNIGS